MTKFKLKLKLILIVHFLYLCSAIDLIVILCWMSKLRFNQMKPHEMNVNWWALLQPNSAQWNQVNFPVNYETNCCIAFSQMLYLYVFCNGFFFYKSSVNDH